MRRLTLLGAGTALLVMLLAGPASADTAIQITGMTCSTLKATGSSLPRNTKLELVVLDQDSNRVLDTLTTTTSAAGKFTIADKIPTAGVMGIRLVVNGPNGRIGFADHQMMAGHEMCPLPYTGPGHATVLLALGAALLALGAALLRNHSYRGTHLAS
jgi:LPXTG-motif cell wall-anchored protein